MQKSALIFKSLYFILCKKKFKLIKMKEFKNIMIKIRFKSKNLFLKSYNQK